MSDKELYQCADGKLLLTSVVTATRDLSFSCLAVFYPNGGFAPTEKKLNIYAKEFLMSDDIEECKRFFISGGMKK